MSTRCSQYTHPDAQPQRHPADLVQADLLHLDRRRLHRLQRLSRPSLPPASLRKLLRLRLPHFKLLRVLVGFTPILQSGLRERRAGPGVPGRERSEDDRRR